MSNVTRNVIVIANVVLIIAAIFLISCETPQESSKRSNVIIEYMLYVKDRRTNLCFLVNPGGSNFSHTYVPCTPEVEKEIEKNK